MNHHGFSKRLNVACAAWGLDSVTLAERSGLALPLIANCTPVIVRLRQRLRR